ncbi:18.5 kDa class I heat shock protein-like [Pyrus ussuriensis x Pyrus communis]|uniref:18.5 kDa class I heat shock protein-like n=1 Tax=Pyrus ussuriensis x Pyrus communis TaxID=2448454 RepID=A0A5N5G052_9ROSA|nr:18.5 kDa class I heat shock protein-like [Pyrus ussuriensis x Pyrus communis]
MSLIPNSRRGSSIFDPFCLNLWDPFKDFPSPSSSSLSAFPEFSRENSAFMNTRVDWKETLEAHVFQLPKNVTVDHIKAAKENGVLSVTVQKAEVKKPDVKAIEIEVN